MKLLLSPIELLNYGVKEYIFNLEKVNIYCPLSFSGGKLSRELFILILNNCRIFKYNKYSTKIEINLC